jgi:hypothetical protein
MAPFYLAGHLQMGHLAAKSGFVPWTRNDFDHRLLTEMAL